MKRIAEVAFQPLTLMGMNLKNRFIRSATIEAMAEPHGAPGPDLKRLYQDLSSGGVGLISTGACCPDPEWINVSKGQLVLNDKSDLSAWQDMVQRVHAHGTRISLQMAPFVFLGGKFTGPSSYQDGVEMIAKDQIDRLVFLYAHTAKLARDAGIDAVQVHGGHGYGLSQFLSPFFNRRDDAYGGSDENRIRLFAEIRQAIAQTAGADFPVWIKMNAFDGVDGGLTPDLAAPYGGLLAKVGYGAIEVTGGVMSGSHNSRGPVDKNKWAEGYYLEGACKVKAATDLPVCAVGGIRTVEMVDAILSGGIADLISLCRPLIREPGLINRWASGDAAPARCISCNGCFNVMIKGQGLFCVQEVKPRTE